MMNARTNQLRTAALLALAALGLAACGTFSAGVLTPTPPATVTPEILPDARLEAPENVVMAREAVISYLHANEQEGVPPAGLAWQAADRTPEGLLGSGTYRFSAQEWTIEVSYPIVALETTVYTVRVSSQARDVIWEGQVDPAGQVTAADETADEVKVVGWLGHVVGLGADSPYDDYLSLQPEGAGEIGLTAADPALAAEIEGLRDKPEPGKYAHFWGTLRCGVEDYNGCRLEVDRLRYGATATGPEPVEGWRGTLTTATFNAGLSYVFVPEGRFPVWHSIHSNDPELLDRLAELANSGASLEVWGEFRTGVPDINGSRIQAREIEVVGQGADPFPGWARYENAEYGIVLRLPGGWSLEESAGEVAPTGPVAPAVVATKDGYRLVIQFARPDEELVLGPSGRGAGSIAEGGEALLLGNRVPTHYLVYEGKIKSMFLGDRFADLEFYIQLDPEPGPGTPAYEDLELPPDVLAEVSRILASISIK